MAKAQLTSLTKRWIDSKTSKNVKLSKHQSDKTMQTLYLSPMAKKLLWQNRVETGNNLSFTIENLILTHLKKSNKEK